MRFLLLALLSTLTLFAVGEDTDTMQAAFIQTITDDKNSTITYTGTMAAKRPDMSMWHYREPIEKSVYITTQSVTIVEPELEQAIVKKLHNSIDVLAILASAKKKSNNRYIAYYKEKEYLVVLDNKKIKEISYTDAFDNIVKITFSGQQINQHIDNDYFMPDIPDDFDIIQD